MIMRRSKELSVFCDPEELKRILDAVLSSVGARLCRAVKREGRWLFHDVASPKESEGAAAQFYVCFPEMIKEGGMGSLANIVQVWFPTRAKGELRMGEVGMLIAESELEGRLCELQGKIYDRLRKELSSRFRRGVWGRNSNTDGQHFYKNIFISKD